MSDRKQRALDTLSAVLPGPVRNIETLRGDAHLSLRIAVVSILSGAQVPDSKGDWSNFREVCARELDLTGNCLPLVTPPAPDVATAV